MIQSGYDKINEIKKIIRSTKERIDIKFELLDPFSFKFEPYISFLKTQQLGYPNYYDWIEKSIPEIKYGIKKIIIAENYSDEIIGGIMWQTHKTFSDMIHIKNLRIDSRFRRRKIGMFLLAQVEYLEQEASVFIGDFRYEEEYSKTLEKFLKECGYTILVVTNLYDKKKDAIIIKTRNNGKNKFLRTITKDAYL